ncbi:MAG: DNA topoisomerase III [Proteobacteria bacterium]|nr:MAG: DNA topoisomerase III [Pseudomonadota bacterium]
MRLFIAEKPSLGEAIAQCLEGKFEKHRGSKGPTHITVGSDVVTWCFGHILEQYDPEDYDESYKVWRMSDLPIIPKVWKMRPKAEAKDQLKVIKKLLSGADLVVHAGDPDREGQLLVDEVLEEFRYSREVQRIWLSATNEKSVKKALEGLKDNRDYKNLRDSAEARSQGDWLVGMNATRKMTLLGRDAGLDGVLSVGRVQTPTLSLVVARDKAIESFKPKDFFGVKVSLKSEKGAFLARWVPNDSVPLDESGRVIDLSIAEVVASELKGKKAEVVSFESKEKSEAPPISLSLDKLQMECNRRFGLSAQETLDIAQKLYEKKLTSYPRTDTGYLPESQLSDAPDILKALSDTYPKEISRCDVSRKSSAWNDAKVTAHHGIIPTGVTTEISEKEREVFDFIVRRYLALFQEPHKYLEVSASLKAEGEELSAKGRKTLDQGWKSLFTESKEDLESEDKEEVQAEIPKLSQGEQCSVMSSDIEKKKTTPPQRFTEASLLSAMLNIHQFETDPEIKKRLKETSGIGTPATRAKIIETLKKRGFVEEKKKAILSTQKGQELIGVLPAHVKSPGLTALFEELLEGIAKGDISKDQFLQKQIGFVTKFVETPLDGKLKATGPLHTCPECKKAPLRKRKGQKGDFWGCSAYPECRASFEDLKGMPSLKAKPKAVISVVEMCKECGKGLIRRASKKGFFWGCSAYPSCKQLYQDVKGKPQYS